MLLLLVSGPLQRTCSVSVNCMMASTSATLPLAFVECLSERQVFAKLSNRRVNVSSYSSASRWSSYSKRVYVKAVSTDRGGPQNAISSEELIETQSSEMNENRQSTPSSSKLVLVVGASGGVGKQSFFFFCLLLLFSYKRIRH